MKKIKLGLKNIGVLEKIAALRSRATAQRNNPHFMELSPSPEEMEAEADKLESAYLARKKSNDATITLTSELNAMEFHADGVLRANANDIEGQSNGDDAKIKSAGHDVSSPATPAGPLEAPDLKVVDGAMGGELKLSCRGIHGAGSYIFDLSEDGANEAAWKHVQVQKKSSFLLSGLTVGKRYWMRMAAVGAEGNGPWSPVISVIAR
jgi:hypothetical protein